MSTSKGARPSQASSRNPTAEIERAAHDHEVVCRPGLDGEAVRGGPQFLGQFECAALSGVDEDPRVIVAPPRRLADGAVRVGGVSVPRTT